MGPPSASLAFSLSVISIPSSTLKRNKEEEEEYLYASKENTESK